MLIGAVSDAHGNIDGLEAALAALEGSDRILYLGDCVGYYPFPNEVVERLRAAEALCVAGNHDAMLVGRLPVAPERAEAYRLPFTRSVITPANRAWLEALPSRREIVLGGRSVLMCHASPWDDLEGYIYPDFPHFDRLALLGYDLVLLGHTHWPLVRRTGRVLVVNPGSCGQPRDRIPGASYARIDLTDMAAAPGRAAYDTSRLAAEVHRLGWPPKLLEYFGRPA